MPVSFTALHVPEIMIEIVGGHREGDQHPGADRGMIIERDGESSDQHQPEPAGESNSRQRDMARSEAACMFVKARPCGEAAIDKKKGDHQMADDLPDAVIGMKHVNSLALLRFRVVEGKKARGQIGAFRPA